MMRDHLEVLFAFTVLWGLMIGAVWVAGWL